MGRRSVKIADDLPFTAEHMSHLETVIKLLRRSLGGMSSHQVDAVAQTLERLRDEVKAEGLRQSASSSQRGLDPVPFRGINDAEPER